MKLLLGFIVSILAFSMPASAQNSKGDVYPSLSEIPRPLRMMGNYNAQFPEQYISSVLAIIRQNGRDKISLDQQDVDAIKTKREDDQKRQAIQRNISYDLDMDGRISRDEVVQFLSKSQSLRRFGTVDSDFPTKQVDVIMKQDGDGDGFVTLKEIGDSVIKDKGQNINSIYNRGNDPAAFLALDPNHDGKLTVDEMEGLARKAFRTVDTNGDGILSPEEIKPLQEMTRQESQMAMMVKPECHLPTPSADEKIVYIGVYEGKAVSNMSVAGQVSETDVIPLHIDSGSSKIFLVTSSFSPVIWKFSGATDRISRLILAGRSMPEGTDNNDSGDGKINVGATGIAADKVTFVHARDCGMGSGYEQRPEQQVMLKAALKGLLGRAPDLIESEYGLSAMGLSDDRLNTGIAADYELAQKKTPAGFDDATWKHHLMFMPGGLIDLKKETIVSDVPAVPYEVLPKWAGISKLVYDGALVPSGSAQSMVVTASGGHETMITGVTNVILDKNAGMNVRMVNVADGYTFAKNVPYYPSGLYGGFSTKFIIKKGVVPPRGIPGHSTVICEFTGKALAKPGSIVDKDASCN